MFTTQPMLAGVAILAAGLAAWWASGWLRRRWSRRWPSTVGRVLAGAVALVGLVVSAYATALATGDRSPRTIDLGPGVAYERFALDEPRRQVFHVVTVDLDDSCVDLMTTIPGDDGTVGAETGTGFVARTGAVASINVAFFHPIQEYPLWDDYPEVGDPITALGAVVVDGETRGAPGGPPWTMGLAVTGGRASAGPVPPDADLAVPSRLRFVVDGVDVSPPSNAYPRAVAGVDTDTNVVHLLVADGKQPGYAEGSTFAEVAEVLIDRGVDEAVEFDGGGSATIAATVGGEVELLNRPSHQRIPGRERPVATHLGVTIEPGCR